MNELTQKQQAIFDFICSFQQEEGYQPSYHDIQEKFGYTSPGTVRNLLIQLERKGYLKRQGQSRGIQILKPPAPQAIPILGQIAAGPLTEALQDLQGTLDDVQTLKHRDGRIALRVYGDSMKDAGILDGDLAILDTRVNVHNGQIAAVWVDGEATLKRLYYERDRVRLQPENEEYQAIELSRQDVPNRIVGRYIGLVRQA